MIQISEPLTGSKDGFATMHDILFDGKQISYVNFSYIREDEIKTSRKYTKRKLTVGQHYGVQVFIDAVKNPVNAESLGKKWLNEIILTPKESFKSLEDKDIYVLELNSGGKIIVGQGSQL